MTMELHCFGESGHSYKAALALALGGHDWTARHIDFFKGGTRSEAYLAVNPMGEAPTLVDGDLVLSQSGVILDYLSEVSGLFGGQPGEAREVLRWVLWDNHKLSSQVGMLRFLMNFLPEEKRNADVIAFTQGRTRAAFAVLEKHLNGRDWIVGDGVTNADLSCCSYLYYPEPFGFDRADYPNISGWLDRIAALPNWAHPYDLMQRAFPATA